MPREFCQLPGYRLRFEKTLLAVAPGPSCLGGLSQKSTDDASPQLCLSQVTHAFTCQSLWKRGASGQETTQVHFCFVLFCFRGFCWPPGPLSFFLSFCIFLSIFLSFFTSGSKYKPPLLWATDELFCRPLKPVPGRAGFIVRVFLFSDWEAVDHTQQLCMKAVMMSSPDSTRTAHNKCKRRIFVFPRPVELKPPSSTGETERN